MPYLGTTPSQTSVAVDYQDLTGVTGNPAKRGFTLDNGVTNANEIEVFVNNVRQKPGVAYTVSGTTLTMTGDVETTDDFYVVFQGKAVGTVGPPDGSVTSAKLVYPLTTFSSTGIDDNATSTAMTLDSSGAVGIGTTSPAKTLDVNGQLRIRNGGATGYGLLEYGASSTATNNWHVGSEGDGSFRFYSGNFGAGTERMRIDDFGRVKINTTQTGGVLNINNFEGAAHCLDLGTDASSDTLAAFRLSTNADGSGGTAVGSISVSGSSTSYNTSSDYRLKENVTDITGATERLKQLNPVRFNFIADADTTVDGFLAHEVQDVVPEAITGTKDAVDDDGNPVYQGIDQSKLVPLLVATIQELEARIAALEAN